MQGVFGRSSAHIVVWEPERAWYRRLRKRLPTATLTSVTLRDRLEEAVTEFPRAAVLIDVPPDGSEERLATLCRLSSHRVTTAAVVLPRALWGHRCWFYQAGASWVQATPRVASAMIRLFERHFESASTSTAETWHGEMLTSIPRGLTPS